MAGSSSNDTSAMERFLMMTEYELPGVGSAIACLRRRKTRKPSYLRTALERKGSHPSPVVMKANESACRLVMAMQEDEVARESSMEDDDLMDLAATAEQARIAFDQEASMMLETIKGLSSSRDMQPTHETNLSTTTAAHPRAGTETPVRQESLSAGSDFSFGKSLGAKELVANRINFLRKNPKRQAFLTRKALQSRKAREDAYKVNYVVRNKEQAGHRPQSPAASPKKSPAQIRAEQDEQWMTTRMSRQVRREMQAQQNYLHLRAKQLATAVIMGLHARDMGRRIVQAKYDVMEGYRKEWAALILQRRLLGKIRAKREATRAMPGVVALTEVVHKKKKEHAHVLEVREKAKALVLVKHTLMLTAGCVQMRARIARMLFMQRVKTLQRFCANTVRRKRFQLHLMEMQWKAEEAGLSHQHRVADMAKLRSTLVKFIAWKDVEKGKLGPNKDITSLWRETLPWDQKTFTLLTSLVEMKAHQMGDSDLRSVATDLGYPGFGHYAVPVQWRREVLGDELTKRRKAFRAEMPEYRSALMRWEKDQKIVTAHISHEPEGVQAQFLKMAGVTARPEYPKWSIMIDPATLRSWIYKGWKAPHERPSSRRRSTVSEDWMRQHLFEPSRRKRSLH
eukprot:TRINITY_DN5706_c0_g1_i1.p1 TRINITY_DN5706_c0_g1~~TRINITY_DN5706_c0_g1_i1.p1  ORF type:complete len:624 (+),score=171.76 TRINITY_DN5706_c0_g1_i1:1937-3808(+)